MQLFGTGRIIKRFGVTTGLLLNPIIMVFAFLAVAFSPVLMILGGIQVVRRVAEYAVAKPTREMLFTVVDQESKYKAKNVIDTVVYRFGDLSSAWVSCADTAATVWRGWRSSAHHLGGLVPGRLHARQALRERARRRTGGRRGHARRVAPIAQHPPPSFIPSTREYSVSYQPGRHFLQLPGPTNSPLAVLQALALPTIDHRGPAFGQLVLGLLSDIKKIFRTDQPVIVCTGLGHWSLGRPRWSTRCHPAIGC